MTVQHRHLLTRRLSLALVAGLLPVLARAQGISADEYQRRFPQPPSHVRAEIRGGTVVISWDAPQPGHPRQELAYDPAVDRYRVYRIGPDETQHLLGETKAMTFETAPPASGAVETYAVSAVQKNGYETARSADVQVRAP